MPAGAAGRRGPAAGSGLAAALLAASCALLRPSPPAEAPPRQPLPAVVEGVAAPGPPAAELPLSGALAAAWALQHLGADWVADELLAAVGAEAARTGESRLRARALAQQAFLELEQAQPSTQRAAELLQAALVAEPFGPLAAPVHAALHLLDRIGGQAARMRDLEAQAATSEQARRRAEESAAALRAEKGALEKQLDELKKVQLRIESEKKDAPS